MKKVLITNPVSLFPTIMMSQKRAIMQILAIKKQMDVSVATFCKSENEINLSKQFFEKHNINFIPIKAVNYKNDLLYKICFHFYFRINSFFRNIVPVASKFLCSITNKRFINAIEDLDFDIIITHYWYSSFIFKHIDKQKIKVLDLHNMEEEDLELNDKGVFHTSNPKREKRERKKSLLLQKSIINSTDILIPNSLNQVKIIEDEFPQKEYYYCPNGQDLTQFNNINIENYDSNTILFYGSMSGKQNIRSFYLFYNNVWPIIIKNNPDAKLIIVGNKPPKDILKLNEIKNINVTGFVENIPAVISKACCMVLPMDVAVGFRGRVVEVMASGVPLIGNHNALDCVGIENERNGFITDDFNKMAQYVLKLMKDKSLRIKISRESISFVNNNFSLEATFGGLANYLKDL